MYEKIKAIHIDELVPFQKDQEHTYEGDWVQQLTDCINKAGLMAPVVIRPVDGGKYEVVCGHNRVKALEILGCKDVYADIRDRLTDDEAAELYYNNRLNQQPFSALSYSQRFEVVKYYVGLIKKNSHQGKRTDLEEKADRKTGKDTGNTYVQPMSNLEISEATCVHPMSDTPIKPKRDTIRDEMARRLGISRTAFSEYRRIIKLPDRLLQSIARLLDEKKITFEAAYVISKMANSDIEILVEEIDKYPKVKLDLDILKELAKRNGEKNSRIISPIRREQKGQILKALTPYGCQ